MTIYAHPELNAKQLGDVCAKHDLAAKATPAGNVKLEQAKAYLARRGIAGPLVAVGLLAKEQTRFARSELEAFGPRYTAPDSA